jgi:hypothetical protein
VGNGSVFSREYYELAASRLKPGGIIAQWFHIYEMHDGIVGLVLRTFGSVFPFVEVWDAAGGDIVLIGSLEPWPTGPDVFRGGLAREGVRSDLESIGIRSAEALLARQLASQRTGFAIAGDGPIQRDLFPMLEYAAPRAFYIGTRARMLEEFDERTRMQWMAPSGKLTVLRALPAADVQSLLAGFGTVNEGLSDWLRGQSLEEGYPCVFATNAAVATSPTTAGSSTSEARLAEVALALNAGKWDQAEQQADAMLDQNPADARAKYLIRIIQRERQPR